MDEKKDIIGNDWKMMFDAFPDLVFIQDKDFVITHANKAFCAAFKMKPEDIIGRKCYEIVHRTNSPWPECPAVETGLDKKSHSKEVIDAGLGMPLLVSTSPIFNEKGEYMGLVHLAKDISLQKKVEDELRKRLKELEVFHKVTMGRESRIIELKKEIVQLKEELGKLKE